MLRAAMQQAASDGVRRACGARDERGITLVIVLWLVAAMTVLVTGLVATQRSELQLASRARQRLEVGAEARAALQRVAQTLATASVSEPSRRRTIVAAGVSLPVTVEVLPMNGLVDLNAASDRMLSAVLVNLGGLDEPAAEAVLAAWRASTAAAPTAQPARRARSPRPTLERPEDLLALGVTPEAFARLAPFVSTSTGGSIGRVNPLAAPEALLLALSGQPVPPDMAALPRTDGPPPLGEGAEAAFDTTRIPPIFLDATSVGRRFRLVAYLRAADGSQWAQVSDLTLDAGAARRAPWQIVHAGPRRLVGEPA